MRRAYRSSRTSILPKSPFRPAAARMLIIFRHHTDAALPMNWECNRKFQIFKSRRHSSTWEQGTACLEDCCRTTARRTSSSCRSDFLAHGKHSIRAGYEYEWTNWPLLDPGFSKGLLLDSWVPNGLARLRAATLGRSGMWVACSAWKASPAQHRGITHFYDVHNQSAYVLDDWKVSSQPHDQRGLALGVSTGYLATDFGRLTQVWLERMAEWRRRRTVPHLMGQA